MPLRSLSEIQNLRDPLKQFQVEFTISRIPAMLLAAVAQKVAGIVSGNYKTAGNDELTLRCTSFSYPGSKISQTELIINGYKRKLAGLQDRSGTWTCKITEDQRGSVCNLIQSWLDLMHSPLVGYRMPSILYTSACQIKMVGAADKNYSVPSHSSDTPKRTLYLMGFYPISYSVPDIDPSSSSAVEVTVIWNYDWFSESPFSPAALAVNV